MAASLRLSLPLSPGRTLRPQIALATLLLTAGCATARPTATAPRPAPEFERISGSVGGLLGEAIHPVRSEILGPVNYDLPIEANSWVQAEMDFLLTQRREVIERWMERGEVYKEFVQEVFRQHGIPADLYHLGLIESGFLPAAKSGAGAVGFWQFMPATGREVGLRVDEAVDERMDPVRSTRAAARHLRSLYRIHRDWTLAAAAYNAGSGRISRGMERFGASDFWDLALRGDLAEETRHYVPRLFAMTIINRNRERLGVSGEAGSFAFDSVRVDYATPLEELARIARLSQAELERLNPHLVEKGAPEGGYWVWVPAGRGPSVQQAYLESPYRATQGTAQYVVRWGDTLGELAERSGLSASRIRELNPTTDFDRLRAGASIRLPATVARELSRQAADEDGDGVLVSARSSTSEEERTHEVRKGDTLSEIAREFEVSVEELREANDLAGETIRIGQRLRIPAAETKSGDSRGAATVEHVVQSGDTLSEIAKRYRTSVAAIQRQNGLEGGLIRPGQVLTVPL